MTRKRFIKLLMSEGYSRNEARDIAAGVIWYTKRCAEWNAVYKQKGVCMRQGSGTYTSMLEPFLNDVRMTE